MNKIIIPFMFLLLSLTTIISASTRIIIYPTDDSYVDGWDPDSNFGSENNLYIYEQKEKGFI